MEERFAGSFLEAALTGVNGSAYQVGLKTIPLFFVCFFFLEFGVINFNCKFLKIQMTVIFNSV